MIATLQNQRVKISIDTNQVHVSSLVNKKSGDDYIKQSSPNSLFDLTIIDRENNQRNIFTAEKSIQVKESNDNILEIECKKVVCGNLSLDICVHIKLELKPDADEISWFINVQNNSRNHDIVEILFPNIGDIYLGSSWEDDTIIYPHHAGEKTRNPIREYTTPRFMNFFRAQTHSEEGIWWREINYCGLASMNWLYYYDNENGLYFGSHDRTFLVTGLRVETGGPINPWIRFSFRKYIKIGPGESWRSEPFCLAVTTMDWHWGAKRYRQWFSDHLETPSNPNYLKFEYTLNQCYNFKQNGIIANRFSDIPDLYERGQKEYHARHMFIASWNRSGFDTDYPEFHPDLELGTPIDLSEACQKVKERGGFTTFYINARIFNIESDYHTSLGEIWGLKDYLGSLYYETYGPQEFTVNCPSNFAWQKHIIDTAQWMVQSYGADGIYLDQLGSAEPFPCFDPDHSHNNIGEFNLGYISVLRQLLSLIRKINPETFLMIENCGDIYSGYVWGNLTWNGDPYDEYFQLYKYTFPEFVQVNMVNPRRNLPMDQRRIDFYKDIQRAILIGSVFWLGLEKFEAENTEFIDYRNKAVQFRSLLSPILVDAVFIDHDGVNKIPEGIELSHWILLKDSHLFICSNESEKPSQWVSFNMPDVSRFSVISENVDAIPEEINFYITKNQFHFEVPQHRLSFVKIISIEN